MSWPMVKLQDICDLKNGYAFKSSDYVEYSNTLSCRMSNIRPGGIFALDYNARYLPDDFADKYSQFLLKDSDVIIAMTDLADSPKILGVPTVVSTKGKNVLLNQRVGKLVIKNQNKVYFPYLKLALNSPNVRSIYKRFAGGGLQINLGKSDLLSVEIPLPPLEEQKRIAAILDKADAIRCKRQQAIQLADDFLKSVFLDMFGDPVTNPKGWEIAKISDCMTNGVIEAIQDGNHGNDHPKVADFTTEGYPFIAANVVRNGQILFEKCYYLDKSWLEKLRIGFAKPRDVLLTHKGTLGLTAVLDNSFDTYIFSPQTTYYRLNEEKMLPEFLAAYFQSSYFQSILAKEGKQSTRAYIGITRQRDLPIILPPIKVQKEFVKVIKFFEGINKSIAEASSSNPELFDSLSQKAFLGKL